VGLHPVRPDMAVRYDAFEPMKLFEAERDVEGNGLERNLRSLAKPKATVHGMVLFNKLSVVKVATPKFDIRGRVH
jgi:hypothetical protein